MRYKIGFIIGAILGMCSCRNANYPNTNYSYQIQGITAYKGQNVSSLFDDNGAPNDIKQLNNNKIMWIYYTNYRPVGGGELISYDQPQNINNTTNCVVKVILDENMVEQVFTNCS